MSLTQLPPASSLADKDIVQVSGPDGLLFGFAFDKQTNTLYHKESQILFPNRHGRTHVAEDPIPNATCDAPGLLSADDKCKLDALLQTRLGILGFMGAGFPDDGGWMQGDVILAAGTEFISIERIGNVIRFTVDAPLAFTAQQETSNQIFWLQDETAPAHIRPPILNGLLPNQNVYGELKVYLFPQSTVVDPGNPAVTLNRKGLYPSFVFRRYDDTIAPGTGEVEFCLKRVRGNQLQSEIGWAMTPGATGVPQCVWFMSTDTAGNIRRFDLRPRAEPGLLGSLLYKGHLITKQMAVITNYASGILGNNQYKLRLWSVLDQAVVGDEFTATNIWRYENPLASFSSTTPKALTLDVTQDILPVGTLVDLWSFQVGEVAGTPILRHFFSKRPEPNFTNFWNIVGAVQFGDTLTARKELRPGPGSDDRVAAVVVNSQEDFETDIWGLTGFDVPVIPFDLLASTGTVGANLNTQHRAIFDTTLPGLRVIQDAQQPGSVGPFNQRPVVLWHRNSLTDNSLIKAEIGRSSIDPFAPYDFLLNAPIGRCEGRYVRVVGTGTVTGLKYVRIRGIDYNELPAQGVLRILSPHTNQNLIYHYYNKFLFPDAVENDVVLAGNSANNFDYPGHVGDVCEVLHREFSAPCVRVEMGISGSTLTLQVKVGVLSMDVPYELDLAADDRDDFVRGLKAGYTVSAVYTQNGGWSGVGTQPTTNVNGFKLYDGGKASDNREYWNTVEIMFKNNQLWVWWNRLLIPPSAPLSAQLPTPVSVSTPYFPLTGARTYGKYGVRMWPTAALRRFELRAQPRQFSEFSYGQLELAT